MIRPPTAAATCTTSASIEASLEEGCPRTQEAAGRATSTARAIAPSAMRRPREMNPRMPWTFTASPEKRHPGEQRRDNTRRRTHCKLEGNHVVNGWSRQYDAD